MWSNVLEFTLIWQHEFSSFQVMDTKLDRFLDKIWHHFRKKVFQSLQLSKNVNNKKYARKYFLKIQITLTKKN